MAQQAALRVVGLISGISADGIDAALVEIQESDGKMEASVVSYRCYPYLAKMRDAISKAVSPEESQVDSLSALNFAIGEMFAAAAADLVEQAGLTMADVDVIGSHGQTVWHSPGQVEIGGMWTVSTLQIGEPAVIAERTGVTVVADFRTADVAAGGRGVPLDTYADFLLFRSANRNRAVQNIGAIGSVTYIPSGGKIDQIIAFDTGPGNMLIDSAVRRLTKGKLTSDVDGKLALAGKPDRVLLGQLMRHPFLEKRPPKSTSPDEFGAQFADDLLARWPNVSPENMVATLTAFTAQSIRQSCERWLPEMPDDVIVGGGVRNPALMTMLAEALPRTKLYTHEDFGINSDAKEALAFALLAGETIRAAPANIPSATGAKHQVVLGKIVPGRNFRALMDKVRSREEQASK